MSAHTRNAPVEYRQGPTIATMTVPALVAVLAFAMVVGMNAVFAPDFANTSENASPTPYSADHARVQRGAESSEEQPPTF